MSDYYSTDACPDFIRQSRGGIYVNSQGHSVIKSSSINYKHYAKQSDPLKNQLSQYDTPEKKRLLAAARDHELIVRLLRMWGRFVKITKQYAKPPVDLRIMDTQARFPEATDWERYIRQTIWQGLEAGRPNLHRVVESIHDFFALREPNGNVGVEGYLPPRGIKELPVFAGEAGTLERVLDYASRVEAGCSLFE